MQINLQNYQHQFSMATSVWWQEEEGGGGEEGGREEGGGEVAGGADMAAVWHS